MIEKHIFTAKMVKDLYLIYKSSSLVRHRIKKYEKWAKQYVITSMNPMAITLFITQGDFTYYTIHPDGYRINFKVSSLKYQLEVYNDVDST